MWTNSNNNNIARLESLEELVIIHKQYYVVKNKMYALLVCFVRDVLQMEGVYVFLQCSTFLCGAEGEREKERWTALGKMIVNQY